MAGCVHVYTGDGKGKTTAALGLILRAAGADLRVLLVQFTKGTACSELESLRRFEDCVTVRRYGTGRFIRGEPTDEDRRLAREGLAEAARAMQSGEYDLAVLDEANIAVHYGLFSAAELLDAVASRAPEVEVVITGRKADPAVVAAADLVTEMREVKHYYRSGVPARRGIEM